VVSFTPLPLYPQGKSPWYPLDRRLGGPQSHSGGGGEEKNSQPPPEIEPQNPYHPACSPALYRLSYDVSHTYLIPILILFSHLCVALPSGLFPSVFRLIFCKSYSFPKRAICPTHLILHHLIILIIFVDNINYGDSHYEIVTILLFLCNISEDFDTVRRI
jgi:hypothetical protein